MPYHIWDTPDYKDLDKKLWTVTKLATTYSTGSALFTSFGNFLPASGRAFLYIYARTLIPTVAGANVGMLTAYCVAKARGNVDQNWNYLPAVFTFAATVAGLRGMFNQKFPFGFRFGLAAVLVMPIIISKHGHSHRQGGAPWMTFLAEVPGDAFGNVRFWRPSVENMAQDWGRRQ